MSATAVQSKPDTRTVARATRRTLAAERKRLEAKRKADWQEQRDEQLAPRAQRLPVLGRDGEIIKGARLERAGVGFIRSNPIKHMVARSSKKEVPLLTKRHTDAADKLLSAWSEAGEGVSFGVALYGVRLSGTPQVGMISDAVLRGVNQQIAARTEIEAIKTRLGARWGCIFSIVIAGIPVSAWGEACGMNPHVAAGFLAACMDSVVDFYAPERSQKIRVIEFAPQVAKDAAD